ncbi:MAG: DUF1330 domain-containing protein [Acidimicrobiaceae bacterium]|nr:DUF1330 domain-containing protein [Acidimicrobiaceae bacterium]
MRPALPGAFGRVGGEAYNRGVSGDSRIELTVRLLRGGSKRQFERYINRLLKLAARHGGRAERRASEVKGGRGRPDAVLVLSFPDTAAVDAYLTDPSRDDLEELAAKAVKQSVITSGRRHDTVEHEPAEVTALPIDPG